MPQSVFGFRHYSNGTIGRVGADATHRDCGPAIRRDAKAGTTKIVADMKAIAKRVGAIDASLGRMNDSLDHLAPRLHAAADQRRAFLAAERGREAAPTGIVSATACYVRDTAGNRIRPMTTVDLQRIADEHYGRGNADAVSDIDPAVERRRWGTFHKE